MWVFNFINGGSIVLILATLFSTNVAGEYHLQEKSRTCIPAETEPMHNSSSCYPLVNFTRPFCQNLGVTLSNYVYNTPQDQTWKNNEGNHFYDSVVRLGFSKIKRYFNVDIATIGNCAHAYVIITCHLCFMSCADRTQSVYKRPEICRETCLNLMRICDKIWEMFVKYNTIRYPDPETKKRLLCKLQPYRNAGDYPECWYNEFSNSTDTSPAPEWTTNADCLYLNGSSYHGNISVTASDIPCQSWTEQCPHRHTMNTTYPELNNAKNYCRNPKNSGQRPWCFTTDRNKRWEYCNIPKCTPVDGNYGNWSLKSTCNVTCGQGFETWTRECKSPEPKYGGRNCSHLGERVEYRPCLAKPCPINGGYSNWSLGIPCNVSCGEGMEIWQRTCDNPEPKYGGRNCSVLGDSTELRNCNRKLCPIDGNYSNWTNASPCSVTCGKGVEIWTRQCDNPPGKYGGNCSKQGAAEENRLCVKETCPVVFDSKVIGLIVAVVFVLVVAVTIFLFTLRKRSRKRGATYYARLNFSPEHFPGPQQLQDNNTPEEGTSSSQETGARYQNLTTDGDPVPGRSRGVVPYRRDYRNTRPSRSSLYDRLQLFRPLAIKWLRNALGNVDEFGRHSYDVMQHNVKQLFVPYDKLGNTAQDYSAGSGTGTSNRTYGTMERLPAVILPTGSEKAWTTEIA